VGGCSATTSALAAVQLGIPLRAGTPPGVVELCAANAPASGRKGHPEWGESHADRWVELASDDAETEIALRRSAGEHAMWFIGSLDSHPIPSTRWDLVAMQEGRAWAPRLGLDHDTTVLPGRKLVARYSDAVGRPVADVVQVATERMAAASRAVLIGQLGPGCPEPVRGALTSGPLKAPLLRDGKPAGGTEPLSALRTRALASLEKLPAPYRRLRRPSVFPVGLSPGLYDLRAGLFARGTER
jgi:nicotinate phosphoribosyltransferase family protein